MKLAPFTRLNLCRGVSSYKMSTTVWRLERYARVVLPEKKQLLPQLQQPHHAPIPAVTTGGNWQHYSSTIDSTIQLALLENNHLVVSNGNQIYESISLWQAKKWLRVITKGDSALFIIKHNDENRRFRVKFSSLSSRGSSLEACRQCISLLSTLIPVSEMSTNPALQGEGAMQHRPAEQLQLSSGKCVDGSQDGGVVGNSTSPVTTTGQSEDKSELMSMSEMAKLLSQPGGQELGEAYKSTNFPTDQLGSFIRLCLTDSHFPGFVEAVEQELNTITHK